MTAAPVAPPSTRAASDAPAAPPSPAPRRLPTPGWLDLRLVAGVVLVLAAVLLGAVVVSRASDTRPVVTVGRDLAVGTTLRAQDLRVVQVQLPSNSERSQYLAATSGAIGKTLVRPVSAGELLPAAAIATAPARTTLTVSLAAGAAPDLRSGQRIELWLTTPTCAFAVLLPEVTVQSVRTSDDGFGSGPVGAQNVVISVARSQVQRVVAAQSIEDATLRAGVLTGASTAAPSSPPGAQADGSRALRSDLPADLAGCAGRADGSTSAPSAGR